MKTKLAPEIYSATNHNDKERKIGFEIEYFGISIDKTARILQKLFGGTINKQHKNLTILSDSDLGTFRIELDALFLRKLSVKSSKKQKDDIFDWEGVIEKLISSTLEGIIPIEIVTPPVLIKDIKLLDSIIEELRLSNAYDTNKSLLTAFGVHINPDVPSQKSQVILSFMQAFILLSDWLKSEMPLDLSRKLSGFVRDYPKDYCKKILDKSYNPTLDELIDDYVVYNSSRNKALDMLPFFAYMGGNKVTEKYDIEKLNPRPTFHYRLANSCFSKIGWDFSKEWQRWLYVESLAKNDKLLSEMRDYYLSVNRSKWGKKIEDYIE